MASESKKTPLINKNVSEQIILASGSKSEPKDFSYTDCRLPPTFISCFRNIKNTDDGFSINGKQFNGQLSFKHDDKTSTLYLFDESSNQSIVNIIFDTKFSDFKTFCIKFTEHFGIIIDKDINLVVDESKKDILPAYREKKVPEKKLTKYDLKKQANLERLALEGKEPPKSKYDKNKERNEKRKEESQFVVLDGKTALITMRKTHENSVKKSEENIEKYEAIIKKEKENINTRNKAIDKINEQHDILEKAEKTE